MDCHSKLVLHLLRNNQPVQVIVHHPRQTTLIFPGPSDQTCMCCSILNMLQLVCDLLQRGRQNRVTVINVRCDKGVDQCLSRLDVLVMQLYCSYMLSES